MATNNSKIDLKKMLGVAFKWLAVAAALLPALLQAGELVIDAYNKAQTKDNG